MACGMHPPKSVVAPSVILRLANGHFSIYAVAHAARVVAVRVVGCFTTILVEQPHLKCHARALEMRQS